MLAISIVRDEKSPSGWAIQHQGEVRKAFERMMEGKSRFPLSFNPSINQQAKTAPFLVRAAVVQAWKDLPAVVITLED